jgi:aminoglycoside 3-N-acetyltransferase I
MKTKVVRLDKGDILLFRQLIHLFQEVFEMENPELADEPYLIKILSQPSFVAFVICCEDKIAGGLIGYELPMYYGEYSELYIYDVAIAPEFQRKGFGQQLFSSVKQYCAENKIRGMFVEASEEDEGAIEFYRSTDGVEQPVRHFDYYLK